LALPYVAEVMVVGVADDEFGERVAAAVCLKEAADVAPNERQAVVKDLALPRLRQDLRSRLAGYKLPTVLRVISDLPKSGTGKVVKKILGPKFFPPIDYRNMPEVQMWNREDKSNL
jgi:malonyl-CoA/methylmalonyl-CoA synthetase